MIVNTSSSAYSSKLRDRRLLRSRISGIADLEKTYSLGQVLGKGNFGTVVKAFHKERHTHWAIKIVNKIEAGASRVRLVEREILILKLVQHPNIIYLDCVFESPKIIFLVFELCRSTLDKLFKTRNKKFEENEVISVIQSLSGVLAYLHKNDIVHRDLKLENILIANNSMRDGKIHIKVSDFGLSVMRGGPGREKMLHEFCGTLLYMAPEVIRTKSYSQQCDVWSMGVIMYVLLIGNFPFFSRDENKLLKLINTTEIDYSGLPCSKGAQNLLSKLLEKNPAFRLTASETEYHHWISGSNIELRRDSSNVFHMMRMWKNEMLKSPTEAEKVPDKKNYKSKNVIEIKEASVLPNYDRKCTINDSDFKIIRQKYWTKRHDILSQEINPSTSKALQPLRRNVNQGFINFHSTDVSDSSASQNKREPFLKLHLQRSRKLENKLPDYSYVLAKVDTNLRPKKPRDKT